MLENIGNTITRLAMDQLGRNLAGRIHHVSDMSAIMRLPWQRPLPTRRIGHSAVMGVWRPNA